MEGYRQRIRDLGLEKDVLLPGSVSLDDLVLQIKEAVPSVLVIAGAGPGFCAGHDLKEMRANPGREHSEALFAQCGRLMVSITHLPKPVIASLPGAAAGAPDEAGRCMALPCRIRRRAKAHPARSKPRPRRASCGCSAIFIR